MRKFLFGRACLMAAVFGVVMLAAGNARAGIITNDPSYPPEEGVYQNEPGSHIYYSGGAFDIYNIDIGADAASNSRSFSGGHEYDQFPVAATIEWNSPLGNGTFGMLGQAVVVLFDKEGFDTGTFQTELLQMDLVGSFNGNPVMIRESPTQASTGETTITDIGGGLYRIDSFFDVFTELSLDGGASWIPSDGGPTRMDLVIPLPGALAMGLVLLPLVALRRRLGV